MKYKIGDIIHSGNPSDFRGGYYFIWDAWHCDIDHENQYDVVRVAIDENGIFDIGANGEIFVRDTWTEEDLDFNLSSDEVNLMTFGDFCGPEFNKANEKIRNVLVGMHLGSTLKKGDKGVSPYTVMGFALSAPHTDANTLLEFVKSTEKNQWEYVK